MPVTGPHRLLQRRVEAWAVGHRYGTGLVCPSSAQGKWNRGRTYTFQASTNFQQWTPVSFRSEAGGLLQSNYAATDYRTLRLEVPFQAGATNRYFRALVQ